tara:strand:+ start:203 stop:409 length:207 start_codon:yes stop_codon:yes gene_type:complete
MFKTLPVWLFLLITLFFLLCSVYYASLVVRYYELNSDTNNSKIAVAISKIPIELNHNIFFRGGLGSAN